MIYTFYSYKGGVGRSMAMANIAELFYRAGMKVLMVDWDLEAPGLEKFFDLDVESVLDKPGVMDMILDYKEKMSQKLEATSEEDLPFLKPKDLALEVYPNAPGDGKLYLLTAGKRSKDHFLDYANSVLSFDWKDFYDKWNGELYFEWFRRRLGEMADVVLVDSRTGVTEMGGVCTYHFADVVVMFCATNKQNLDGTYEMARNLKDPDVLRRRNGRPIDLLIVPSRVEDRAEAQRLTRFHKEFVERFKDLVPENLKGGSEAMWRLKIPQVPYYAFNEMVATRQTGEVQSEDLANAFVNLTDSMASLSGKGEILGRISKERENIRTQKLRDFTVQIKNNQTETIVGTGIIISVDGKILTTYKVAMAALGMDPFKANDEVLGVRFPQSASGPKDRMATVLACTSESVDDGLVMLQLKDGPASLKPEQVAVIGIADGASEHSFIAYGFSVSQGYAPDSSIGIIQSEEKPKVLHTLKSEPLKLKSSQGATDLPGAAVLDTVLDIVVGLISASQDGKTDRMDALSTHILAFSPFNLPVHLNTGDAYARKSRYKDAIEAYKDAIDADPNQVMAWLGLGKTYARIERIGESIDSFNKALEIQPDLAQAWLHLGDAYLRSNEYEEAIYAFERAIKLEIIDQDKGHALAGLGKAYRLQSRYDEAINAYNKAVEVAPKMASVWRDLGDILLRIGQYGYSIKAFNEAIEIEPYKRAEITPLLERANRGLLEVGKEEMARSLEEKERSLDEVTRSLEEKERSIDEKTRSLKEKDQSLDKMTRTLEERERSIDEKTRSLKEKDRSLDEMTRTLLEEKDRSLAKKTMYNRILAFVSIVLVIAAMIIINSYSIMNQNIYNNPLYWKGEGQATLLGIGQPLAAEPNYNAAIEAFNKSLEIANKAELGYWTPQSNSETWWLMGNAYLLLGNKFESENDAVTSKKWYNESLNCYKKAIDIYQLNYDSWVKKAQLENKLNLPKDAENSSLQAIRINPNYGYQAWGLWTDSETHPSELAAKKSEISLNNFILLNSKYNPGHSFIQCILPSNMST
jgi:tetratricopeptide (TPR) repeat protein